MRALSRASRLRLTEGALVVGLAVCSVGPLSGGAARADDPPSTCESVEPPSSETQQSVVPDTSPSAPLGELAVPAARDYLLSRHESLGGGVNVAVVDSGVADGPSIRVVAEKSFTGKSGPPTYFHGTAVAGLIAGRTRPDADGGLVGIAPDAGIVDLRVYEAAADSDSESSEPPVSGAQVLRALEFVRDHSSLGVDVVNVSLGFSAVPGMQHVISQLWSRGVIVVAATGNRPTQSGDFLYDAYGASATKTVSPVEDAADSVFPAGYRHVVGVNATAAGYDQATTSGDTASGSPAPTATPSGTDLPDPTPYVLSSSATDVAAPTAGGVSFSLAGAPCELDGVFTSWSTAEVSGILALLRATFPHDSAAQLVARLEATASGGDTTSSTLTGAGVVQPLAALSTPLQIPADGRLPTARPSAVAAAPAPTTPPDVLRSTRHDAVWWGLLGGGGLALMLLLRPVLSRRRAHS